MSTKPERKGAREVALQVLEALESRAAFLQPALEAAARRAHLDARDRGLALELASGVTRWQARLDHGLAPHIQRGLAHTAPTLRHILRLAAYQMRHLERIPVHAAVNAAVDQARAASGEGAAKFVNAVLRALARTPETLPEGSDAAALAIRGSHPLWLVERWLTELPAAEVEALCAAHNAPATLTARADVPRAELLEALRAEGAEAEPARFAPDAVHIQAHPAPFAGAAFREGRWRAQDEAAQLVVLLLDPRPGEAIWDVCAAPGGKSEYIAGRLEGQGRLSATDVHPAKVDRLRTTLAGRTGVEVAVHDGRTAAPEAAFDAVLLDAPCTGLGTIRRHPETKWRRSVADIAQLAAAQADLLRRVARAVRPGGRLVYSVCTITPEEGPALVAQFLAEHAEFTLESPTAGAPGVDWAALTEGDFVRTWPHRHGMDGFFAARLRRRS